MCKYRQRILAFIVAILVLGLWSGVCLAADSDTTTSPDRSTSVTSEETAAKSKEKDISRHPVAILRGDMELKCGEGLAEYKGHCNLTLKNMSGDDVEGVKVKLVLREGSREIKKMEKEVGTLEAGDRQYVNFKWDDFKKRDLEEYIWITYTDKEGDEITFETRPHNW